MRQVALGLVLLAASWETAAARPDGAPWGAADPAAAETCASCHFDNDPVRQSDAVTLAGLSRGIEGGKTYKLALVFADPDAASAGFLITASAGTFSSPGDPGLEARDSEIRSISAWRGGDRALWEIAWRAPETLPDKIVFHVAVNAGNDDASPFGDHVHYREYVFDIPGGR